MTIITLKQISDLQYKRATEVMNEQMKQLRKNYTARESRNLHSFAHKERLKYWPRGKAYQRMYRREMNPHINFTVSPQHPDRYKHMVLRMWC